MRIIISPAKKMRVDNDTVLPKTIPQFLLEAELIKVGLQDMSAAELQKLWKCNDALAELNIKRLNNMDLDRNLTPAILAYEGIQYQYMAPGIFEEEQYAYIEEHLRILSGFYGLLRPFDGVVPYRLEMQAKLEIAENKNLYTYWGRKLADQLCSESNLIINLASKEYSKVIEPYCPPRIRFITCSFVEWVGTKLVEKGTMCKIARGQMVRYLAEQKIVEAEQVKNFGESEYCFSNTDSIENNYIFIKGGK